MIFPWMRWLIGLILRLSNMVSLLSMHKKQTRAKRKLVIMRQERVQARTGTIDKGKEKVSQNETKHVEARTITLDGEFNSDDDSEYNSDKSVDYLIHVIIGSNSSDGNSRTFLFSIIKSDGSRLFKSFQLGADLSQVKECVGYFFLAHED
uniref:Uncharacterized protein n=1 Tax=Tanacetum cinerariifolium TaxID=118510 RepID=A0A699JXP4_TANCI|nr:hypothetical protein [Tanacetum cinerariifolium]